MGENKTSQTIDGNIKSATISKTPSGKYYVSFLVETVHQSLQSVIKEIGLDNYIEDYKDLNKNEKINFNNKEFLKILHNCLKKYIIYMANYDIELPIISKFVKGLNNYFPFLKSEISKLSKSAPKSICSIVNQII